MSWCDYAEAIFPPSDPRERSSRGGAGLAAENRTRHFELRGLLMYVWQIDALSATNISTLDEYYK